MDLVDAASGLPKGVYHTFDIPFFYANLGQNAADRVRNYLSLHPPVSSEARAIAR